MTGPEIQNGTTGFETRSETWKDIHYGMMGVETSCETTMLEMCEVCHENAGLEMGGGRPGHEVPHENVGHDVRPEKVVLERGGEKTGRDVHYQGLKMGGEKMEHVVCHENVGPGVRHENAGHDARHENAGLEMGGETTGHDIRHEEVGLEMGGQNVGLEMEAVSPGLEMEATSPGLEMEAASPGLEIGLETCDRLEHDVYREVVGLEIPSGRLRLEVVGERMGLVT